MAPGLPRDKETRGFNRIARINFRLMVHFANQEAISGDERSPRSSPDFMSFDYKSNEYQLRQVPDLGFRPKSGWV